MSPLDSSRDVGPPRTRVLVQALAALVAIAIATPLDALAQAFPSRPVQVVVPFGPGGSTDAVFRLLSEPLAKRLGQPVVIVNRPGGATTIGMGQVASSAPDGHTLGVATLSFAANGAFLQSPIRYDAAKDFAAVTLVFRVPMVMTVNPQVPAKSVGDLVALARSGPAQLNYASSGVASSGHVAAALFEEVAGVKFTHVPYNSLPISSVIAGDTHLLIGPVTPALQYIRNGRLRALGVTTKQRVDVLPDVPTFAEDGVPGYEFYDWAGLVAPAGTPPEIVARLHTEMAAVLADDALRKRIAELGCEVIGAGPADFRTFLARELARWPQVALRTRANPTATTRP